MAARPQPQVRVVVHAQPCVDRQPGVDGPEIPRFDAFLEHGLNPPLVGTPPLPERLGVLAREGGEIMQEDPDVVAEAEDHVEQFLTEHGQLLSR